MAWGLTRAEGARLRAGDKRKCPSLRHRGSSVVLEGH